MRSKAGRYGNLLVLKHFDLKVNKVIYHSIFKQSTPLLNVNLLSLKNVNPTFIISKRVSVIVYFRFLSRSATQVLINNLRTHLLTTLAKFQSSIGVNTCINISLLPSSMVASGEQISNQLQEALRYHLAGKKLQKKKLQELKEKGKSSLSNLNFTDILFPFSMLQWLNALSTLPDCREYNKMLMQQSTLLLPPRYSRIHWIISHHYKLKNSRSSLFLIEDMVCIMKIFEKFNFFIFLDHPEIHLTNHRKFRSLCLKLIKSLKWKSGESEQYLCFLVNIFGPSNIMAVLEDFKVVSSYFKT